MDDHQVFRDLLFDTVANNHPAPGLIYVAIVYHNPISSTKGKGVHTSLFQCHPDIHFAHLAESYSKRYPGLGDVTLYHNDDRVAATTKLRSRAPQAVRFIVLQALPASWTLFSSSRRTSSALLHARQACVHLAAPASKLRLQLDANLSPIAARDMEFIANVDELCVDRSADELEVCAQTAAEILNELARSLSEYRHPQATRRQADIEALLRCFDQHFQKGNTTIAVVGATGSGKSSLINALLGLPDLIPTGCTSACTSVATEIEYNWKDSAYRAEIRFMKKEAWRQMLERLFHDIRNEDGTFLDPGEEGSESAIALAQLITVYPELDVRHLENVSMDELMSSERLNNLGEPKYLDHTDPHAFSEELRHYLSSESGLWPLIACVKIFVRAPVLATGAIIVDLPGTMDTNQARSYVAKRYMQECDHIFVVSPAKRAVDDRVAHNLAAMAPKEQVQLDGLFGNITFICTLTDDAKPQEISAAYRLQSDFKPLLDEASALREKIKGLQDRVRQVTVRKASLLEKLSEVELRQKMLSDQREDCINGKTIYARKTTKTKSKGHVKTLNVREASPGTEAPSHADIPAQASSEPRKQHTPFTIARMMDKKEVERKKLSQSIKEVASDHSELQGKLDALCERHNHVDFQIRELAIIKRNKQTKQRIGEEFGQSYQSLVQACGPERNDEDRARNVQDIANIEQGLKVFMVSSAAYQALQEELVNEPCSKGFKDAEATEIPQLRKHCRRLTDKARTKAYRRFLADSLQYLASLQLWASEVEQQEYGLSNSAQRQGKMDRRREQRQLKLALEQLANKVVAEIQYEIRHRLYTAFDDAVRYGKREADSIAMGWGLQQVLGGLHYKTYRAVLKHLGEWTSSRGVEYDFNKQLGAAFKRRIGREWEVSFTHLLPYSVKKIVTAGSKILDNFFEKTCERNKKIGTPLHEIETLRRQLPNYKEDLASMANKILEEIQRNQRQINRQGVEPVISNLMLPVYRQWVDFHGKGMLERMRTAVERHVSSIAASQGPTKSEPGVFEDCKDKLKKDIDALIKSEIKDKVLNAMEVAIETICRSFNDLGMGPGATVDAEMMDPGLKKLHKEVREVLNSANSRLLKAVLGEQVLREGGDDNLIVSKSKVVMTLRAYDQDYDNKSHISLSDDSSDDEMDVDD